MPYRFNSYLIGIAALCASALAQSQEVKLLRDRTEAERPAIMFVGSPHLANHNRDVITTTVPDVLTPERQAEIADVVAALAHFKPTKIAVELASEKQAELHQRYTGMLSGSYTLSRNEMDQFGMRIAAANKLPTMYAVDWNKMPPGQMSDLDYQAWAKSNGMGERLTAMTATSPLNDALMKTTPVASWLIENNAPEKLAARHRRYFDYAMLGNDDAKPGANWVASWYGRNLKIFGNLVKLADNPKDRILVIYGSGHIPLLREFAVQSGAFTDVDPMPLLREAASAKRN